MYRETQVPQILNFSQMTPFLIDAANTLANNTS